MTGWRTLWTIVLTAVAFATGVPAALAEAPSTAPRADACWLEPGR